MEGMLMIGVTVGLNAYFTYTVVGFHGSGPVSYGLALTAVFVEGFIFFALSLFGMRQWLARAMPKCIKLASGVGIGLYLCSWPLYLNLYYSKTTSLVHHHANENQLSSD